MQFNQTNNNEGNVNNVISEEPQVFDEESQVWCGLCKWHGLGKDVDRPTDKGLPFQCPQCKQRHGLAVMRDSKPEDRPTPTP